MSELLMWLVLAAASAPAEASCPSPGMALPRYPIEQLRRNIAGKMVVLARIDDCGKVVEAKVDIGSGHAAMDDAAIVAALASVLSPEQRTRTAGHWVKLPFTFGGISRVTISKPDWPASHRRPRYLPDDQPLGFDSIKALNEANLMRPVVLKSPYSSAGGGKGTYVMTRFEQEKDNPKHFWLAYTVATRLPAPSDAQRYQSDTVAMARYRLVFEAGEPVVRLGLLCEASVAECAQLSSFLLKGLPTAKPPRS